MRERASAECEREPQKATVAIFAYNEMFQPLCFKKLGNSKCNFCTEKGERERIVIDLRKELNSQFLEGTRIFAARV